MKANCKNQISGAQRQGGEMVIDCALYSIHCQGKPLRLRTVYWEQSALHVHILIDLHHLTIK